jgi:hypothetical protein
MKSTGRERPAYNKRWRDEHLAVRHVYDKCYREEHCIQRLAYDKSWREENREDTLARRKRRYSGPHLRSAARTLPGAKGIETSDGRAGTGKA